MHQSSLEDLLADELKDLYSAETQSAEGHTEDGESGNLDITQSRI